jgi:hypothetical protein
MSNSMKEQGWPNGSVATDLIVRPGDFPLGSLESRAAARALAGTRSDSAPRIQLIHSVHRPHLDHRRIHVSAWGETGDGRFFRCIYVPPGLSWPPQNKGLVCWDCTCKSRERANFQGVDS